MLQEFAAHLPISLFLNRTTLHRRPGRAKPPNGKSGPENPISLDPLKTR
jgi:hypothetical protein